MSPSTVRAARAASTPSAKWWQRAGPLIVLYAADLDTMESKVRAAGAEILSHETFEGGRRFHFRDPNGNEIGVWTKA
ncbi:MAG: hypothetical protein WDM89_13985 [Rhizomicrobium sp.]